MFSSVPCWLPSSSITSFAAEQKKSTIYGPIVCCLRNRRCAMRLPRRNRHSVFSASVAFSRKSFAAARLNCARRSERDCLGCDIPLPEICCTTFRKFRPSLKGRVKDQTLSSAFGFLPGGALGRDSSFEINSKASASFSRSRSTRTVPPFLSLPNRISSASGFLM